MTSQGDAVHSLLNMLGEQTHAAIANPTFRYLTLNPNRWVLLGMSDENGNTRGQEIRQLNVAELQQVEQIIEKLVGRRMTLQLPTAYVALPGEGTWSGKWISVITPPVTDGLSFTIAKYIPGIVR